MLLSVNMPKKYVGWKESVKCNLHWFSCIHYCIGATLKDVGCNRIDRFISEFRDIHILYIIDIRKKIHKTNSDK